MYTEVELSSYIDDLENLSYENTIEFLEKNKKTENFQALVEHICNISLDIIQRTFYKYDLSNEQNTVIDTFVKATKYITTEALYYYKAVACYFKNDRKNTIKYLKTAKDIGFFSDNKSDFTIDEFALCFIAPFKNGYPGFWDDIYYLLSDLPLEKGVLDLCKAVDVFYNSEDTLSINSALINVLTVSPESLVVKEMLAINYYNEGKWGNAVALLEQIGEKTTLLFSDDLYFMLGWGYGKLKETVNEIAAYKKSYEIYPEGNSTLNNLGYAYYKAKQYNKAIECFEECIKNKADLKYSANNYVRTLLAVHRYKDAKQFIKNSPVKIYKNLLDKVTAAPNSNAQIKNDKNIELLEDHHTICEKDINIGVKKQQFTSEKILEDELALRIESGIPVFGKKLKIYRRNGIYGRQYILSNGKRPDLLAEDDEGNLYVIELKKDSGYDDAYEQTVDYLNWFDANWGNSFNNIYGIICLNNPTSDLLNKIHKNKRVRVFEYQISYTEL